MKKLLFPVLVAGLFMSCSSNDNDETVQEEVIPILPVKISSSNGYSEVFTYKNKNELAEVVNNDGKEVYTYEGDNIIKVEYYENNKLEQTTQYVYTNNRVTKDISTYNNGEKISYDYEWVTDNHIKYKKVVNQGSSPETGDYYYTNGNLTKYTSVSSIFDNEITYEYDNYNNPYSNIKGYNKINILYSYASKNNVQKFIVKTKIINNGTTTLSTSSSNYTYIYLSNNFPNRAIEKYTNQDNQTTTNTTEFKYNQ